MLLFGSTGSIGVNTIQIAKLLDIDIEVLGAGKNITLLNEQIAKTNPKIVVIADEADRHKVNHNHVLVGEDGIKEAICNSKSNLVVNAIVGFAGLVATSEADKLGKKIALANKESLVVAGKYFNIKNITPIDSEHFGLWYLLRNNPNFNKLHIGASGGALRDMAIDEIKNASLANVLNHPNWSMGAKITIDSATMMNKIFEVLEAKWLFDTTNIDAFIETRSLVHSVVEYHDGSSIAHFANVDMKLPISFALRASHDLNILTPIDLKTLGKLEFRQISTDRYPLWKLKDLLLDKPQLGVVANAANEIAIEAFVKNKITFDKISTTIFSALHKFESYSHGNIKDVQNIDKEVRAWISNEL